MTAKYEDDAHIGTKNATLTVSKATPTGAPTCTKITTSGKTLADAPLAMRHHRSRRRYACVGYGC